jgi:hypothetical protein
MAGAVDEIELGLKAITTGWDRDRHSEVASADMQVGCELLADPL